MSNVLNAVAYNVSRTAASLWQEKRTRVILQVLFLIGMGAVAAMLKKVTLPLGIPGHSGVLWLGAMIAGRALINKDGAGTLMGMSIAVWGIPMGLNNGFAHNFGLYATTGLMLDVLARMKFFSVRNPVGAIFAGIGAHLAKFVFNSSGVLFSTVTKKFLIFGFFKAAGLHIIFGAAAGLLGWGAYYVWNKRKKEKQKALESQQ